MGKVVPYAAFQAAQAKLKASMKDAAFCAVELPILRERSRDKEEQFRRALMQLQTALMKGASTGNPVLDHTLLHFNAAAGNLEFITPSLLALFEEKEKPFSK